MRVPQRLDYAMRTLILLALQGQDEYIAGGELADHLGLPRRFVEQQITALARAGIVRCRRGASGGCALARPAREVTALEVVEAVQGDVLDVPHVTGSAASTLWADSADELARFLGSVSLDRLADEQRELDAANSVPMYYI
jgi:Rrf2 family protein